MFVFVAVAGLSLGVSAQKDDKKPPKNPPTVDPKKPSPPPRDDKKPKKPGSESGFVIYRKESDLA